MRAEKGPSDCVPQLTLFIEEETEAQRESGLFSVIKGIYGKVGIRTEVGKVGRQYFLFGMIGTFLLSHFS